MYPLNIHILSDQQLYSVSNVERKLTLISNSDKFSINKQIKQVAHLLCTIKLFLSLHYVQIVYVLFVGLTLNEQKLSS